LRKPKLGHEASAILAFFCIIAGGVIFTTVILSTPYTDFTGFERPGRLFGLRSWDRLAFADKCMSFLCVSCWIFVGTLLALLGLVLLHDRGTLAFFLTAFSLMVLTSSVLNRYWLWFWTDWHYEEGLSQPKWIVHNLVVNTDSSQLYMFGIPLMVSIIATLSAFAVLHCRKVSSLNNIKDFLKPCTLAVTFLVNWIGAFAYYFQYWNYFYIPYNSQFLDYSPVFDFSVNIPSLASFVAMANLSTTISFVPLCLFCKRIAKELDDLVVKPRKEIASEIRNYGKSWYLKAASAFFTMITALSRVSFWRLIYDFLGPTFFVLLGLLSLLTLPLYAPARVRRNLKPIRVGRTRKKQGVRLLGGLCTILAVFSVFMFGVYPFLLLNVV
jgi:hypothetical protein